jgi:two-component system, LytTR family, sensor kinase
MPSREAKWIILIGVWLFVGLVLSTEVYFNVRVREPDVSFMTVAMPQYVRVLYWALLTPFILRLRRTFPFRRGKLGGSISLHVSASFLVMAVFFLGRMAYILLREGESLAGFWEMAHRSFFGRNLIDIAFYWAVIAFGHTQQLQQRVKNEELKAAQLESRLMETELKALKQQLHPHFLFNTLNTISVLVREKRNEEAVHLIARLSALLRMSLDSTRVHEVTLRQEMEFLKPYLEIQKARFLDRLTVHTDIAPEALEAKIPNLLLQPLVENAIVHGVTAKNAPGTIEIKGQAKEGNLYLEVRDDGPGFSSPDQERVKEGIGLSNTRTRLSKIYGTRCQMLLRSQKGGGASVQIVLPFRT